MRLALVFVLAPALAWAEAPAASDLYVLTRDGRLARIHDQNVETVAQVAEVSRPMAIAALDGGRVALWADGKLLVIEGKRRRTLPGHFAGLLQLASTGRQLSGLFAGENPPGASTVASIDLTSGRHSGAPLAGVTQLFGGGGRLCAAQGAQVIELELEAPAGTSRPRIKAARSWRVPGRGRSFAVDGDKLYVATREGPLWEYDFSTGKQRDLGLGGWWGTVALAAGDGRLYAATQAGKLWLIDPIAGTKTILQMSGWEGTLALAASAE